MARIRTIKPEFWSSLQVIECSTTARLLFVGLWNFSDDAGRHIADCRRVKVEIFPGDSFSIEQIRGWIDELIKAGLLVEYTAETFTLWQVTGWSHQRIEKRSIKYPGPESSNGSRTVDDRSSNFDNGAERSGGKEEVSTERSGASVAPWPHRAAFFADNELLRKAAEVPVERKSARSLKQSAFATFEEPHLSETASLVEWHARQLSSNEPVMGATEADLLLVIATAIFATNHRNVKTSRVGIFIDILTKHRFRKVVRHLPKAAAALAEFRTPPTQGNVA